MSDITVKQMAELFGLKPEELDLSDLMICSDFAPRPQLIIAQGDLPRTRHLVHKFLCDHSRKSSTAAAQRVFSRLGALVHLSRNEIRPDDLVYDEDGKLVDKDYHVAGEFLAGPAVPEWLAELVEIVADVCRYNPKGELVPCDLPLRVIHRLMAAAADWKFPELAGTVETPTMRQDGTILDKPGYDRKSGLYFDPNGVRFPPILDRPTKAQGAEAIHMLERVLIDFPFADEDGEDGVSLSVALAGMLTAVVRRMLPTAPLFGVDANEVESGKTLLAQVWAILMTGKRTGARPLSMDPYQQATALAAAFEASDGFILFDNVAEPMRGAPLDMAITESAFTMRRLGGNSGTDQIKALTNSMLAATGNKLKTAGDLSGGRVVLTKIVPDEALSSRKFTHWPLDEHIITVRPALVAAALTALRAYVVAGYPERGKHPTFRLQKWRDLIADALIWYGHADPCKSVTRVSEGDPLRESRFAVIKALHKQFGAQRFTTNEALDEKSKHCSEVLTEALPATAGIGGKMTKIAMSFLDEMHGVRLGPYRLHKHAGKHGHATQWAVKVADRGHDLTT